MHYCKAHKIPYRRIDVTVKVKQSQIPKAPEEFFQSQKKVFPGYLRIQVCVQPD